MTDKMDIKNKQRSKKDFKMTYKEFVICEICLLNGEKGRDPRGPGAIRKNLAKHMGRCHMDFVNLRCSMLNEETCNAISKTVDEMTLIKHKIPEILIKAYKNKMRKGILQYFKRSEEKQLKFPNAMSEKDHLEKQKYENMTEEEPNQEKVTYVGKITCVEKTQNTNMKKDKKDFMDLEATHSVDKFFDDHNYSLQYHKDFNGMDNNHLEYSNSPLKTSFNLEEVPSNSSKLESVKHDLLVPNHKSPLKTSSNLEELPSYSSKPKTVKQALLFPKSCDTCNELKGYITLYRVVILNFKNLVKKLLCTHPQMNCCCRDKKDLIFDEIENKVIIEEKPVIEKDDIEKKIFYKEDNRGDKTYFCNICHKYDLRKRMGEKNDFYNKGTKLTGWPLKQRMQKHIKSNRHKQCSLKADIKTKDLYSSQREELGKKTTENLCLMGQFFATHNLTQRFHPQHVLLIEKLNENLGEYAKAKIHLVGNVHHSTMSIKEAQIATFYQIKDKMKEDDNTIFLPTGQLPRYMLAFDKGTAVKDSQRQPIVMTKVDPKTGLPTECLVAASVIPKANAKGALDHVTSECKKVLSTERVVFTSSDNESVYAGNKSGVGVRMTRDESYSEKIIRLDDICHRVEKMMFPPAKQYKKDRQEEQWVIETTHKARQIIGLVLTHPKLTTLLRGYAEECKTNNVIFHTFQPVVNVRFSEYLSGALNCLIKNLTLMIKVLPIIISDGSDHDSLTKDVASKILTLINDRVFIARLFLLDKVFQPIAVLEKSAQAKDFGPLDYIEIRKDLIKKLENSKFCDEEEIKQIVDTGKFMYSYHYRKDNKENIVNLDDINLRKKPSRSPKLMGKDCWDQYQKWVDNILRRLDTFLNVPECVNLVVSIFNLEEELTPEIFDKKLNDLRDLFILVNTDFEVCGELCENFNCICLKRELDAFLKHVYHRKDKRKDKFIVNRKIDYLDLYRFYLCEDNISIIENLAIKNVLRALEVCMIMKPSQSSTERVVSQIKRTVRGRFENIARFGKVKDIDMVNVNVFLRMNSSIQTMDPKKSAKIFTQTLKHRQSIKKTKPLHEKSITLKRLLKNPIKFETNRKKPFLKLKSARLLPLKESRKKMAIVKDDFKNRLKRKLNQFSFDDNTNVDTSKVRCDSRIMNMDCSNEISKEKMLPQKNCLDSCRNPKSGLFEWVRCVKKDNCKSKIKRDNEGYIWGDWFHDVCIGVKYHKKKEYLCYSCEKEYFDGTNFDIKYLKPVTNLHNQSNLSSLDEHVKRGGKVGKKHLRLQLVEYLKEENKQLLTVIGDGDCFFSALSICMYGDRSRHEYVRTRIYESLEQVFRKYQHRILTLDIPTLEESKENPELYFLHKMLTQHIDVFKHFEIARYKKQIYDENINCEQIEEYIRFRKLSCREDGNVEHRWGNDLDYQIVSLVDKVNIYVVREFAKITNTVTNYVVETMAFYDLNEKINKKHDRQFYMLLYEHTGAHYSPIIPIDIELPLYPPTNLGMKIFPEHNESFDIPILISSD